MHADGGGLAKQAPGGMLARGHYTVKSKFIDDDNETHLAWEWFVQSTSGADRMTN